MANVKLERLKIEKYRNVAPGTELVFNDGFNVLLGKNGTGKTTLLKLLAMVAASRFGSLREVEFSLAYTLGFAGARVEVAIENARSDAEALQHEPFTWSYRVELKVDQPSRSLLVVASASEMLVSFGEKPEDKASVPPVNPFERNLLSSALLSFVKHLFDHGENVVSAIVAFRDFESRNSTNGRRFDELLGGLDAITGAASTGDVPAASYQFVRLASGATPRERARATFIPNELARLMSAHDPSSRSLDGIAAKHEGVDFLQTAVALMGFKGAEMLLRLRKREPVEGGERLTFSNFELTITLDDDAVIPHDALSYGQKRLVAFLYYVAANDDVIIADEIVNGMHYDWIEACLREIGARQSFLTTQNPLLLDFFPFTSEHDVERTFLLCSNEQRDGRRQVVWKNMSQKDARAFYRSYQTKVFSVSAILRANHLW
jgi:energy-coupling factor transporter ATP-binding protein EcfA2